MSSTPTFNDSDRLDLLAAHAPQPPPEWYRPAFGGVAPVPGPPMTYQPERFPGGYSEAIAHAHRAQREHELALEDYNARRLQHRLASWPWYYAKMVLDARPVVL